MLGDLEKFGLTALSIITHETAPEHYGDLSNIDLGPIIAYPYDYKESIDAKPSNWLDEPIAASRRR